MKQRPLSLSWLVVLLVVLQSAAGVARAGEWTFWRGPTYNGVSTETGLVSSWSPEGEHLIWKAEFIGRSTPVVLDGQACVIGRVGEEVTRQEVVACFDAENGRKRWEHRFNVYNTTVPFNRVGWASLAADPETGNIYAHGVAGQLICYDRDGKILWSRFLAEEIGRLSGYGGRTQTPLVDGDQLILSFVNHGWGKLAGARHRYFSFDKRTGDLIWVSTPGNVPKDMNTQSGPVIAEIGGKRLLIGGNADGWIYALKASTGEKVWSFHLSQRGINSNVLVAGDRVFASHSEENVDDPLMGRLIAIDGTGSGDITATHELWRINELSAGFPSPAYKEGKLYVVDNSANLHRINVENGEVEWQYSIGTVGKASPVLADGKIYVNETNGRVHILRDGDEGPTSLSVHELKSEGERYAEIYGSAAIAYGRIYFATEGGVYCVGDKSRKIDVAAHRNPAAPAAKRGRGKSAWVQVVPADKVIKPGEHVRYEARAFDAAGNPLGAVKAEWSLQGLQGTIKKSGRFEPDGSVPIQSGTVIAKVGELTGEAGVRVIADLPWEEDFESYDAESVPGHWVAAMRQYRVEEKDGNKVLVKRVLPRGLLRTATYMGPSQSNYTIEADLMGSKQKRRMSDIGVIAGGYTLDMLGNAQRVQVRSWASEERMAQEVDFAWQPDVWYRAKLRVDTGDDKALIRGKIWKKGDPEPAAWTIEVEDPLPIPGGSPGLIGYSPADIYFDNIKVTVNK